MRIERERNAQLAQEMDRIGISEPEGGVSLLLQTFAESSYPTDAGAFYACHVVGVDGDPDEGAAADFTAGDDVVYAYNLGSEVPPENSRLLAHLSSSVFFFTWNVKS